MIALLRLVPIWAYALAAILALLGLQTYRLSEAQSSHNAYVAQIEGEARIAEAAARQEETRRQTAIEQVRTDAQKQKALDDARIAANTADNQRMRDQTSKLLADRSALSARLAARGKSINDLTDMLATMRQQLDDFASAAARDADEYRGAGFACERAYDSLRISNENR